jgi:hypothetical protein
MQALAVPVPPGGPQSRSGRRGEGGILCNSRRIVYVKSTGNTVPRPRFGLALS